VLIYGWLRTFTVLGLKIEECSACGETCQHVIGRKVNWGTVFWIPILFLGFSHGMFCTACQHWTGIPFLKVRDAMKTGSLPLSQLRPHAQEVLAASAEEGQPPLNATMVYDRMAVNPKRGKMDLYLKLYPVLIGGIIAVAVIANALKPPPPATVTVPPHTCWEDATGTVVGCRLLSGEVVGTPDGTQVTCYFAEPVTETTRLNCED
jgi:hypothetical protein